MLLVSKLSLRMQWSMVSTSVLMALSVANNGRYATWMTVYV